MAAELCSSVASGVAENLVEEYLVRPVIQNIRYAFCFDNIVRDFREQTEKLQLALVRLQHDVDEDRNQVRVIEPDVLNLLAKFVQIQREAGDMEKEIEENISCFNWCPNGWCRWSLSKTLAKTTLSVKSLVETPIPNRTGYRATDSGPELSSSNFITFESRKSAFEQIMQALKADNVNMIGLHGMGGMGKTTLVEEVQREAKRLNLFKYVVIALVSQNPKPEEIQKRIADKLQLQFTEESVEGRADLLWKRLRYEGKVLIILDDVWRELNVEKIGIPHGQSNYGSCKILLTTRVQSVCAIMRCQRTIELQVLEEKEARKFFEINADLNNPPRAILKVAPDIVKRCRGLPIAIVTLGKALRGKTVNQWKSALQQLESYRLMDISVTVVGDKDVFTCLMLSYIYLKVQKTKQCFLLCASFPDHEIDVEDLVRCAWGLQLYQGATLDTARTEVLAAIDELRDSSLLLASGRGGIKMHDMFRNVALFIRDSLQQASQEASSSATSGVRSPEWLRSEICLEPYDVKSLTENYETKAARRFQQASHEGCSSATSGIGSQEWLRSEISLKPYKVMSLTENYETEAACFLQQAFQEGCSSATSGVMSPEWLRSEICPEPYEVKSLTLNCETKAARRFQRASHEGCSSATSEIRSQEWLRSEISLKPYKVMSLTENYETEAACLLQQAFQEGYSCATSGVWSLEWPTSEKLMSLGVNLHWISEKSLEALLLVNAHRTAISSETMKKLKVLTIAGGSLGIYFLLVPNYATELRTLNLVFCGLKEFSLKFIWKLKKLEILTIHNTDIEQLPKEIEELKSLRLLDLSECGFLQIIPPSLLEKLSRLEELYLGRFTKWATTPEERNARLSELNSLTCLRALSLAVPPTSFPNDFVFHKLDRYEIVIHESRTSGYPTTQSLQIQKVESLNAFRNLFPEVQYLELDGIGGVQNVVPSLDQEGLIDLTSLALESCHDVKCLVERVVTSQAQLSCLSELTTLKIANCSKLKYIFPVSLAENLPPLRVLHLTDLPELKDVLGPVNEQQSKYVVIKLPFLKELKVTNCPQLSAFVVSAEIQEFCMFYMGESNQSSNAITAQLGPASLDLDFFAIGNFQDLFQFQPVTTVSKLKVMLLNGLTRLQIIWKAPNQCLTLQFLTELVVTDCNSLKYIFIPALNLPQLRILKIIRCHGLEQILQNWQRITSSSKSAERHIEHSSPSFPNLSHIKIECCGELKSLFPSSVGHCLGKLEVLCVDDAPKLKQVFAGSKSDVKYKKSEHPNLGRLVLQKLPKLESFSPLGHHFQFPSLNQLLVTGCPRIITCFSVDSNLSAHAKTEASGSVHINVKGDFATTDQELTWPGGSDINWQRKQKGIN